MFWLPLSGVQLVIPVCGAPNTSEMGGLKDSGSLKAPGLTPQEKTNKWSQV